ncbi:ead/Ea22-like family protein [Enterobacter mori]|uniref:Ead/Ea22-like family protein n=1 Tax=Enterobacter mori TaxID=539813 RepID=A0A9Q7NSE7_9ENTR|nr:ead/Ea22-like family protein [Enterobacter mori]MCC8231865.1 ead/Ea22-like family protein [Enterobacter mori]MCC8241232.1 ead/Ea22-like family protein [Enterobacter mori]RTQ23456.1 ead/Ea22-like family protein [Enterobacter mori]
MSNIDKRALREAAKAVGKNDWQYVYTRDLSATGRGYITVGGAEAIYCLNKATGGVKQSENLLRYIAAANPDTFLALLDEMEAAERRNTELTEALRQSVIGYKSCLRTGHDRILDLGGDCDAPEVMIAGNPDIQQAEKLLAAAAGKGE